MKNIIKLSLLALAFGGSSLEAGRGRGSRRLTEAGRMQQANHKAVLRMNEDLAAQRKAAEDVRQRAIKRADVLARLQVARAEKAEADRQKADRQKAAQQKAAILRAQFEKDNALKKEAKKIKLADCLARLQEERTKKVAERNARKLAISQHEEAARQEAAYTINSAAKIKLAKLEAARQEAAAKSWWTKVTVGTAVVGTAGAVYAGIKNPAMVKQIVKFGKKTMKPVCKAANPYVKQAWNFGKNLFNRFAK
jgi:hypothetical protein